MADVARVARCDASTVSLALRNDLRISAATRTRVQRVAAELGYQVHPMVAAWVAARRARHPANHAVPLGYLTTHPHGVAWGKDPHFASILDGARERAKEFGYQLTQYQLTDYEDRITALNRVLFTRAVQGLIIGPTLRQHEIHGLEWERFSVVTIGYALKVPAVHRVTEDHYFGMKMAFEACLKRGHRRIGLAITGSHHPLRRERWIGAYLAEQCRHLRPRERLPFLEPDCDNVAVPREKVREWARRYRPDVVLADQAAVWESQKIPTLGFAISGIEPVPGVHENNRGIGRNAADLLIALLQRNERGLPPSRQTVLVEPELV
jgi:DNA-binding LacI/PurR family transcriptional regulator